MFGAHTEVVARMNVQTFSSRTQVVAMKVRRRNSSIGIAIQTMAIAVKI